jgi:hypothetical protein
MKKIICYIALTCIITSLSAQDFKKNISQVQSHYTTGKLQDAHFALQQMMQDLDITIGREVLKLFPLRLDTLSAIPKQEEVFGNTQFTGVTIEKNYGITNKKATLSVVINSPLLNSLNAYITSPLMAGLGSDPNTRIVKVGHYKARLTKEAEEDQYKLEIPMTNALLTLTVLKSNESEILAWAGTLPLEKMASLIQ